jgi:hypothetical protein
MIGMGAARRMENLQYKTLGVIRIPVTFSRSIMNKGKRDVYDQSKQSSWQHNWVAGLPRNHNHSLWKSASVVAHHQALHQLECLELGENPTLTRVVLHMQRKWLILDDRSRSSVAGIRHDEANKLVHQVLLEALAGGDSDPSKTSRISFLRGQAKVLRGTSADKAVIQVTAQIRWGTGPTSDLVWNDSAVSQHLQELSVLMSAVYTKVPADHLGFTQTAGTLYSYTVLIHCTHTLYSYIALIHCTHTLYLYTVPIHCTHTGEIAQRQHALVEKMTKIGGVGSAHGGNLLKLLKFMETDQVQYNTHYTHSTPY